jgi:hypothetical protein
MLELASAEGYGLPVALVAGLDAVLQLCIGYSNNVVTLTRRSETMSPSDQRAAQPLPPPVRLRRYAWATRPADDHRRQVQHHLLAAIQVGDRTPRILWSTRSNVIGSTSRRMQPCYAASVQAVHPLRTVLVQILCMGAILVCDLIGLRLRDGRIVETHSGLLEDCIDLVSEVRSYFIHRTADAIDIAARVEPRGGLDTARRRFLHVINHQFPGLTSRS